MASAVILGWFAKTCETHFSVILFTTLFCPHFSLCFQCISLYYTLAITLCFAGFCKRLYKQFQLHQTTEQQENEHLVSKWAK